MYYPNIVTPVVLVFIHSASDQHYQLANQLTGATTTLHSHSMLQELLQFPHLNPNIPSTRPVGTIVLEELYNQERKNKYNENNIRLNKYWLGNVLNSSITINSNLNNELEVVTLAKDDRMQDIPTLVAVRSDGHIAAIYNNTTNNNIILNSFYKDIYHLFGIE
jgi:hypothetical protein